MQLEPVGTEVNTGTFRVDLIARNVETDGLVLIENQFARSDHDHLGKALTYLAAKRAETVIWMAEVFADEHRAALEWLNENTPEGIDFWGVVPKVLQIGNGPPGLRFDVIIRPNFVVKRERVAQREYDPDVTETRRRYWPIFEATLREDHDLTHAVTRFGGGLGYMHVLPDARYLKFTPSIHVLAFLQVPAKGARNACVWMRPNPQAAPQWSDRIKRVQSRIADECEQEISGDFKSDQEMREIARKHVASVKAALRVLADEFEPEAAAVADAT